MDGNNAIEAVFIPDKGRGTLCVSSQVGCALNCQFCSTATQGFNRNLSTAEIIGQVWVAAKHLGNVPHKQRKLTNRSEEHTSELQSLMRISYAVFCLKKKHNTHKKTTHQSD